ncbi:radical SAM protein [Micromonospora sp. DR5-3]|uniref:radical SAM/SPASM domain-containing protein n=1 Tax=unclassified Micromonospora TaxID=2617518 RepID=UPI00165276EC|nr:MULTISPECIES: radical SAM protein [unclassified Micromonospora]MCW3820374.1 radical SAM protein [Micromonospora sp. DR5-3]
MRVSSYAIGAPLADDRFFLLFHGLRGSLDKVTAVAGAYLVEHRGEEVISPPWAHGDAVEEHLRQRGYLTDLPVERERELLVEVASLLHEADLAAAPPSFVFVPAYTCNLRCPYCFQGHDMHAGKGGYGVIMSRELVDDAFRVIDRCNRAGAISRQIGMTPENGTTENNTAQHGRLGRRIGLFGGEPLSGSTREVVEYIVQQARRRGAAMWAITNGVQLDAFADLLGPDGLSELQITLDGMPDLHDRRRVGPRFRQTFHRIVDNIDLALAAGVQTRIRINVDRSNVEHVAMLSDLFAEKGWSRHPAFHANAAVVSGETTHQPLISRTHLTELTSTLRAAQASCVTSYEGYATTILGQALAGGYPFHRATNCSAETGLLMFAPRGELYGCWDEIGLADRQIGQYRGGVLNLDEQATRAWLSRFPGAIEQCSRCPYALIHNGGCANHAYNDNGTIFAAACEGFQAFFPRTLAEAYEDIERQLLGDRAPTRKQTRRLPILQITNGRADLAASRSSR